MKELLNQLTFAIGTKDGYYFVRADYRLPNLDYVYHGKVYTAIEDEDDIVTYRLK